MENPATTGFWLSPQQRRVWEQQQDGVASRSVCLVMIEGSPSVEALDRGLRQLVARHEILRTVYRRQPGMKFPFQVVLPSDQPSVEVKDLSGLSESEQKNQLEDLFRTEQVRASDPETGPVLVATIAVLGADRSAFILSLPALAADRLALQVVARELGQFAAVTAAIGDEEPLRYVQFTQWQNDLVEGADETSSRGREFWQNNADEPQVLALPNEFKARGQFSPQLRSLPIDTATGREVESLAARFDATTAEVLLAAGQSLLWRLTGQPKFQVGTVFMGREYDELRDAVGLIEKTIPIDSRFDGDFRFREVVEHLRTAMAKAAEWQEHYVPGTGFGSEPPVNFEYAELLGPQTYGDSRFRLEQISSSSERFKLKLSAIRNTRGLTLKFHYDGSSLTGDSVDRISRYFQVLLSAAVADPESYVSRLPLLPEAELRQLVVDWNQTAADYPRDKCLHELFEAQAALTPDRPALRFNEELLSYRELNERANQVAHYMQTLGVGPNSLVGLCVERSAEMMVALLGILKAGGAYVPLNPDNPKPRLAQQLAGAIVLLTGEKQLGQMPAFSGKTICLDRDRNLWSDQPRTNPSCATTPQNLVYVIYTSGSTGVPKGVAVRHRNLVNYSHFITRRLRLEQHPEGLHFGTVSTIGADLGNTCIYPSLISGGCLHVIGYDVSTDAQRFARYTSEYPIDVLKIVPSHLQALLHSAEARQVLPRKFLILGGETLTPKLLESIQGLGASCEVLNHYGPTETTVGSLTLRVAEYDWKNPLAASIPIGRPIANTQVYLLDTLLQPVPLGVVGELYVAGDGVTAGYLNQPDRTAERFVRNPFVEDANAKMYRTGDLARYLTDGNIEFLGRGDDQVKIRGFRIELGEIESVLAKRAGVKQAVILAKDDERGDKRLLAYVVADRDQNNSPEELRAHLKQQLPEFMVPSAIVLLPRIPLTANGKIDRQALPEPEAVETKSYIAPKTATEESVAKIWADVLRRDRISTDDNFFDLGGHSLLATQVISRMREQFRIELPIRALFESPTVSGLAEAIDGSDKSALETQQPAIVRVSREQYRASRS
ncbi:MAG TPA: amino acid adenylation domain-containing protein [Terriglobales bacterium]